MDSYKKYSYNCLKKYENNSSSYYLNNNCNNNLKNEIYTLKNEITKLNNTNNKLNNQMKFYDDLGINSKELNYSPNSYNQPYI